MSKYDELFKEIKNGKPENIERLLPADINEETIVDEETGNRLLDHAIEFNRPEVIELLINRGIHFHYSNHKTKHSALSLAIARNRPEIARLLLDKGYNINFKNGEWETPLTVALECNNFEFAKELIERGANTTEEIFKAIEAGNIKYLEVLLPADVNVSSLKNPKTAERPLKTAVKCKQVEVLKFLINRGAKIDVDYTSFFSGKSPLIDAIEADSLEMVKVLVENGAQVNPEKHEKSPLFLAALWKKQKTIQYLVEKGANPNFEDCEKTTPMMFVAALGSLEIFKKMVENGGNINAQSYNWSVLQASLSAPSPEIFWWLVKNGVDLDKCNKYAPYIPSAVNNKNFKDTKVLDFLLENSFKIDATDGYGRTAFCIAAEQKDYDKMDYLLAHDADINKINGWEITPLMNAAKENDQDMMTYLIEHGANINAQDVNGETALFKAIKANQPEALQFLIEQGIDINAKDREGNTALHIATRQNNLNAVIMLLEYGAVPNAMNNDEQTPLQATKNMEVMQYLKDYLAAPRTPIKNSDELKQKIDEVPANELADLPKSNPQLLQKIIAFQLAHEALKRTPEEQRETFYSVIQSALNPKDRKKAQKIMQNHSNTR